MKLKKITAYILFVFFSSSVMAEGEVVVYFLPFQVETFVPVTTKNIICWAAQKWEISSGEKKLKFFSLLKSKNLSNKQNIDFDSVRVKIVYNNSFYYIDSAGVVFRTSKKAVAMVDEGEFQRFGLSLSGKEKLNIVNTDCSNTAH